MATGPKRDVSNRRRAVMVVRPYGARIRDRVFGHFEAAGLAIRPHDIIPVGTSDEEAIERVLSSAFHILLVPFHGQRDDSGATLDGLHFVQKLLEASPDRDYRVIMPVSRFGAAAMTFAVAQHNEALLSLILFITEEELDDPKLAERIKQHVS